MPDATQYAQVRVPAPFLYAGFLLAAILLHWAVPLPAPFPAVTGGLGWVAVLAGLLLGLLALQRMRHAHTPVSPHRPATALVTDGPYRFTRNPIYLGFLLVFLGFTGLAGTLWGALLSPLVPMTVNWLVIGAEEAHLQARFTDRYARYKSRVPKWI